MILQISDCGLQIEKNLKFEILNLKFGGRWS